eukprot:1191555-Rhodomonas_salina.1
MLLRARYAMSGTDVRYGDARRLADRHGGGEMRGREEEREEGREGGEGGKRKRRAGRLGEGEGGGEGEGEGEEGEEGEEEEEEQVKRVLAEWMVAPYLSCYAFARRCPVLR